MTSDAAAKLIFAPAGNKTTLQADQYLKGVLGRDQLNNSPIVQFKTWFSEAEAQKVHQPETVCLSTAHLPSGRVSSRYVYLKELDSKGFIIYSNWGTSRKASDLASNPRASLAFWWPEQERQVRVEGTTERLSMEESQKYFDLRARGSKIGAWASLQSSCLPIDKGERAILDANVEKMEAKFAGVETVPVPAFWGGLRILPDQIEFWQGRDSRLHDRFRYTKAVHQGWDIERLSP